MGSVSKVVLPKPVVAMWSMVKDKGTYNMAVLTGDCDSFASFIERANVHRTQRLALDRIEGDRLNRFTPLSKVCQFELLDIRFLSSQDRSFWLEESSKELRLNLSPEGSIELRRGVLDIKKTRGDWCFGNGEGQRICFWAREDWPYLP